MLRKDWGECNDLKSFREEKDIATDKGREPILGGE